MFTKEIWYSVGNGGDGSAYPTFMESEALAELDQKYMEEGWGEPCTGSITVQSESPIMVINRVLTAQMIKEDLESELKDYEDKTMREHLNEVTALIEGGV